MWTLSNLVYNVFYLVWPLPSPKRCLAIRSTISMSRAVTLIEFIFSSRSIELHHWIFFAFPPPTEMCWFFSFQELHEWLASDGRVCALQSGNDRLRLHLPECPQAGHSSTETTGLVRPVRLRRGWPEGHLHPHLTSVQPRQTRRCPAGPNRLRVATIVPATATEIQTDTRHLRHSRCADAHRRSRHGHQIGGAGQCRFEGAARTQLYVHSAAH